MTESLSKQIKAITKVAKGEIWIAYDEKSDKTRPFVIMSSELSGIDIDVAATPTTTASKRNSFDIPIEFWKEAGLDKPCIARCSKLHVFSYLHLVRKLGSLYECDLEKINEATRKFLGL